MLKANKNLTDSELSKEKLWKLFLGGDLKAWGRIYTFFYNDLYGYGLQLSSRRELTEDSIHELFVVLWVRRKHISEVKSSVKAYLLSSLRRRILKRIKKDRETFQESVIDEQKNTYEISPEEKIISSENELVKEKIFKRAVSVLTKREKEILFLKYFNGMSYSEIENMLKIEYQSIRNHIYRAKVRMRDEVKANSSS